MPPPDSADHVSTRAPDPKHPGRVPDLPECSDPIGHLRDALARATSAEAFAAAVERLSELEAHADDAAKDADARAEAADADRVLVIRGWSLVGRWLQRHDRSEGGRGRKGGLYAAARAACDPPISEDQADDLRWIGWIPDDELEARIKAGIRSKRRLATIGRVEFPDGKPSGRSADGRSATDDRFTFIKNVERHIGSVEIDAVHDIADALPDTALRSRLWHVLGPIQLALADLADRQDVDVDPRRSVALLRAMDPSYGEVVNFVRLLAGYGDDALRAQAQKAKS